MAWYWWILIVVAVVALGAVKLSLFNKIMRKKQDERKRMEEDED